MSGVGVSTPHRHACRGEVSRCFATNYSLRLQPDTNLPHKTLHASLTYGWTDIGQHEREAYSTRQQPIGGASQSVAAKGRAHQYVHEQVDDVEVQLDGGDDEVIDAHPVDDLVGVVNLRAVRERR